MASERAQEAEAALAALRQPQLNELLDSLPGVRRWLSGDAPQQPGAGAVLTSKEAATILDVERQRLWRWEKAGRIDRVATTNSGPLYMRVDVYRLLRGESQRAGARRGRREPEQTADPDPTNAEFWDRYGT